MANRIGIDLLRYSVDMFGWCRESFNQLYSADDLLKIADACQKSNWDIFPDKWEERQVKEAIQGKVPDWIEDEEGDLVAFYKDS